jgi:hypothetical protein
MNDVDAGSTMTATGPAIGRAASCPFGPDFFLVHLRRFVRDCCPSPDEGLPRVSVCLVNGEVLELCRVVALSTCWVALAVFDETTSGARAMRTDIVPYPTIQRVVVRGPVGDGGAGFRMLEASASGETAERLLEAAGGAANPAVSDGVTWLDAGMDPDPQGPR